MSSEPEMPLVSIIMAMRNSASTLGSAISSIRMQTLANWELVLIDDGSTDDSADIVASFSDRRIRLYRDGLHLGLAARLNQAVGFSRGRFIARMDSDDIAFPERLEVQLEKLMREPGIDVVGCGAVVFNNLGRALGLLSTPVDHTAIAARPFDHFPFPHPTWCGRAQWFKDNPYNPKMMTSEDYDLLLRTFSRSHFAGVDCVLLGYRQDQLQLKKIVPGRRAVVAALWRRARSRGQYSEALRGTAIHFTKLMVDFATIKLGGKETFQKRRLRPAPLDVLERWEILWSSIAEVAGNSA